MKNDSRQPLNVDPNEVQYERPALTNLKLDILILSTFGLIVAIYKMRYIPCNSAMPLRKFMEPKPTLTWLEEALFWPSSSFT
jgi:hypothetical protein